MTLQIEGVWCKTRTEFEKLAKSGNYDLTISYFDIVIYFFFVLVIIYIVVRYLVVNNQFFNLRKFHIYSFPMLQKRNLTFKHLLKSHI